MARSDDEILEYLSWKGSGTPEMIAEQIGKNSDFITRKARNLEAYGLVERPSRGFYTLTDVGEQYLAGEIDADELDPEEPE